MGSVLVERVPEEVLENARGCTGLIARLILGSVTAPAIPIGLAFVFLMVHSLSSVFIVIVLVTTAVMLVATWAWGLVFVGKLAERSWSQESMPVVELAGEQLRVTWHGELIEASIRDCNLRVGSAAQMKYARAKSSRWMPSLERDVILIDLPPLFRSPLTLGKQRSYTTVAVGYTEDSFKKWAIALEIEGSPQQCIDETGADIGIVRDF